MENIKTVKLSQIKEDLLSGLTRWKKDDIGFGSIEKKYGLTIAECVKLFAHPKLEKVESMIPVFLIEDDLEEEVVTQSVSEVMLTPENKILETRIVVAPPPVIKKVEKEKQYEAFI